MSKFVLYGQVVIEAHENYQKASYRNRCRIAAANGVERLSIPLKSGKHQQKPIQQVEIAYDEPWHQIHWKSIVSAYSRAPYFAHYRDSLEPLVLSESASLFHHNLHILHWLLDALQLKHPALTGAYDRVPLDKHDLRNTISPKVEDEDLNFKPVPYFQMFDDRHPFQPNLSVLDLLFSYGPETRSHLRQCLVLGC